MERKTIISLLIIFVVLLSGCKTIEKAGINMISDVMAGEGSAELFTGDNDPELVKDALPFILKMYEMLSEKNSKDSDLLLATGSTFIMYSNVFIQTTAIMLPDERFMEQYNMLIRSKKMYQRGTEYVLQALELRHKGFRENLDNGMIDLALADMDVDDVPYLYWAASGLMGAFSTDPFDFSLGPDLYKPVAFLYKALSIDETFSNGNLHDLLILLNSSVPDGLMFKRGESESPINNYVDDYYKSLGIKTPFEKARFHFNRSIEISGGNYADPYISLATTVSVNEQDLEEYERLLNAALEIDPDAYPEMRLAGLIFRDKAQWYLDHKSDYFLLDIDEGDFDEVY